MLARSRRVAARSGRPGGRAAHLVGAGGRADRRRAAWWRSPPGWSTTRHAGRDHRPHPRRHPGQRPADGRPDPRPAGRVAQVHAGAGDVHRRAQDHPPRRRRAGVCTSGRDRHERRSDTNAARGPEGCDALYWPAMGGTPVRILLARHGETVFNVEGRWQGQADSPLTERGRGAGCRAGPRAGRRADRSRLQQRPGPRHGTPPARSPRCTSCTVSDRGAPARDPRRRLDRQEPRRDRRRRTPAGCKAWATPGHAARCPAARRSRSAELARWSSSPSACPRMLARPWWSSARRARARPSWSTPWAAPSTTCGSKSGIDNCQISRLEWTRRARPRADRAQRRAPSGRRRLAARVATTDAIGLETPHAAGPARPEHAGAPDGRAARPSTRRRAAPPRAARRHAGGVSRSLGGAGRPGRERAGARRGARPGRSTSACRRTAADRATRRMATDGAEIDPDRHGGSGDFYLINVGRVRIPYGQPERDVELRSASTPGLHRRTSCSSSTRATRAARCRCATATWTRCAPSKSCARWPTWPRCRVLDRRRPGGGAGRRHAAVLGPRRAPARLSPHALLLPIRRPARATRLARRAGRGVRQPLARHRPGASVPRRLRRHAAGLRRVRGAHACALRGLNDAHLLGRGLERWERSGLFRVRSNVHDPYYGRPPRVFLPARTPATRSPASKSPNGSPATRPCSTCVHAVLVDQCAKGFGYPAVLARADDRAVISLGDRDVLDTLVQQELARQGVVARPSAKLHAQTGAHRMTSLERQVHTEPAPDRRSRRGVDHRVSGPGASSSTARRRSAPSSKSPPTTP